MAFIMELMASQELIDPNRLADGEAPNFGRVIGLGRFVLGKIDGYMTTLGDLPSIKSLNLKRPMTIHVIGERTPLNYSATPGQIALRGLEDRYTIPVVIPADSH